MNPAVAIAVAAVAIFVLFGRKADEPGERLGSKAEQERLRQTVQNRFDTDGPRALRSTEEGLKWAAVGMSLGAAIGGPIGGTLGAAIGFMVAAIASAAGTDTWGQVIRDSVKKWLKEVDEPSSPAAIDAMLFREALFAAEFVWYNKTTGELAVEVTGTRSVPFAYKWPSLKTAPKLSLRAARPGALGGDVARDLQYAIVGWTLGRLDGPSQRETRRRWMEKCQTGDLYPIEYQPAPSSWRDPGTLLQDPWFASCWPSLGTSKIARSSRWERIVPAPNNVDMLAARFDKAAGVDFKAKAAA